MSLHDNSDRCESKQQTAASEGANDHQMTSSRALAPSQGQETGGDVGDGASTAIKESELLERNGLFETLPDELVLAIFQLLPRAALAKAAQVCQRWKQIAYDPVFWKAAKFGWHDTIPSGTLDSLLARGCLELNIEAGCKIMQPMFTGSKPEKSYALKELIIDEHSKHDVSQILSRCRELTRIETEYVAIDDDICRQIGECPNLISVILSLEEEWFSCDGILAILRGCRRLEQFHVNKPVDTLQQFNDAQLWSLIDETPPMMKDMQFLQSLNSLQDEHVELLVSKAPLLTELVLRKCPQLTDKAMQYVSRLKHLTDLNVDYCTKISYAALRSLSACKNLREIFAHAVLTSSEYEMLEQHFAGTEVDVYQLP